MMTLSDLDEGSLQHLRNGEIGAELGVERERT
jgi:hypothetical protein